MSENSETVACPIERPFRQLVYAYEDHCGVERGRFDGCTLAEMEDGAAFGGFDEFAAGWCAAVEAAIKEAERRIFADNARLADECKSLRQMLTDCEQYLKDGETPAQRIERERRDTEAVLNLLVREKERTETLRRALHDIAEEWAGAECGEPVHAQEAYAIGLAKRMYALAAAALAPNARLTAPDTAQRSKDE